MEGKRKNIQECGGIDYGREWKGENVENVKWKRMERRVCRKSEWKNMEGYGRSCRDDEVKENETKKE